MSDYPEFPTTIDLGRKIEPMDMPDMASEGKKGKPKVYYPTLYISGIEDLKDMPEEGMALIRYKRKSLTVRTDDSKDEPCCSADLEIQELHLPEEGGGDDMAAALKKLMDSKASDGAEDDETDGNESEGDE